jgi:hypothetical protein
MVAAGGWYRLVLHGAAFLLMFITRGFVEWYLRLFSLDTKSKKKTA